jgi:predicted nucleic acid-binding protein
VKYLLDTNVVSEARKPRANSGVLSWLAGTPAEELFLSVLVLGEIRQGIVRLAGRDPKQAEVLARWMDRLRTEYADRLVPVTVEIAEEWGRRNATTPLPVVDGLLGATAVVMGMTLVSRNSADLERTGARVLNPFSSD